MIFDKTGNLANMSRHDYLPFGEEVFANAGSRTTTQGYTAAGNLPADKARQKFTGYEQDAETGLNFAEARYDSSAQGRFTSADSFGGSGSNPQSLNRYAYVNNNPMNYSDPTGHVRFSASSNGFAEAMGDDGGGYMYPENPDNDTERICGIIQRYGPHYYGSSDSGTINSQRLVADGTRAATCLRRRRSLSTR